MRIAVVTADSKKEAAKNCRILCGWMPEVVIRMRTANKSVKSWKCFESAKDVK